MALNYQEIFGDDFEKVLNAIDQGLPDQVEKMVLGRLDQMIFKADTFSNEITRTVQSLAGSGVTNEQIQNVLKQDMVNGGKIFGALRNGTKEEIVNTMNQASRLGQFEEYGPRDTYVWVTVGGHKICSDCDSRAGQQKSYDDHAKEGLPGSGWSLCGGYCYCVLDPIGKIDKELKIPNIKAEKGASVKKPPPIDPLDRLVKFIKPSTYLPTKRHIERNGTINFKGISTAKVNVIANAIEDTLGKYNVNIEHLGIFKDQYKARGANAAAWRARGNTTGQVIAIKKTYINSAKKVSKNSREGFEWNKNHSMQTAYDNIALSKKRIKDAKESKERFKNEIKYYENQIKKNQRTIDRYSDPKLNKWSISSVADDPLYATTKHEAWHQIDYQLNPNGRLLRDDFYYMLEKNNVTKKEWGHVSEYASSSIAELWAETGTALDMGFYVPPNIKKAFIETIENAGYKYP